MVRLSYWKENIDIEKPASVAWEELYRTTGDADFKYRMDIKHIFAAILGWLVWLLNNV